MRAHTAKTTPNREACGGLYGKRANFRHDPTGKHWLQKNMVLKVTRAHFYYYCFLYVSGVNFVSSQGEVGISLLADHGVDSLATHYQSVGGDVARRVRR